MSTLLAVAGVTSKAPPSRSRAVADRVEGAGLAAAGGAEERAARGVEVGAPDGAAVARVGADAVERLGLVGPERGGEGARSQASGRVEAVVEAHHPAAAAGPV